MLKNIVFIYLQIALIELLKFLAIFQKKKFTETQLPKEKKYT